MFLKNILCDFSVYIGKAQNDDIIDEFMLKWRNPYSDVHLDYIVEVLCVENNILKQDFFKDTHLTKSVLPRQIFSWVVYKIKHYTQGDIMKYFLKHGLKRNRTTILHSIKVIQGYIDTDKEFKKKINEIKRLIL